LVWLWEGVLEGKFGRMYPLNNGANNTLASKVSGCKLFLNKTYFPEADTCKSFGKE
jgi:hypothetical protein